MTRISATILLILFALPGLLKSQPAGFFDFIDFRIRPVTSINTVESDISPGFVDNELFFTSVREEFFGDEERKEKNMLFYDLYRVEIDENGNPVTARELVPGFGNMYHEGPASWCKKTGELFVTMNNSPEGSRKSGNRQIRLRLVIMKQIEGRWEVTMEYPFNNPDFHFAHPAISVTGDTLIFSSDMDGGFGKSDLYMSVRTEGQWSKPENLGGQINTPGNEMFPTFGPGGMLLFSSDSLAPNFGQLDIYYTTFPNQINPKNIGEKINSDFDDFGLSIHSSKKFGYFSSNRYNWRKDDIYLVEFFQLKENIRGKVVSTQSEEPVQDAMVILEDCEGNRITSVLSGYFGNFEFEVPKGKCYQVYAEKEGFSSEKISYSENEFIQLPLKQIFNYQVVVKDFENESFLSEAEMTCNGMTWKSDSYGAINIEFDSIYDGSVSIGKAGYFEYKFDLGSDRFVPGTEISDTVRLIRKQIGKIFTLKSIDYFIDMWRLMPKSEPELNQLVKLLEDNPALRIEISAHTDSRLEDQYNMWLSQKRADSVLEYLVQKGISKDRIEAKGYGETRLLNRCSNGVICSEEQHLVNRRTEFVILEF